MVVPPTLSVVALLVIASVGATVSITLLLCVLAALVLPAASVTAPAIRSNWILPVATPGLGVTVTSHTPRPLYMTSVTVPLAAMKSLTVRSDTVSLKV